MKLIFKYIIVQCLLFVSIAACAHNPDLSSTILIEQSEDKWVLQIRAALTAFEYEVESSFGGSSYATPEEFQELVVRHVRENMLILFNDNNQVELKNGMVKLGHETSVTFEVIGSPTTIKSLQVMNSSFKDIPRNQSALMVLKKGFTKEQFTLNAKNLHTAELKIANSKFVLVTTDAEKAGFSFYILGGILLVFSIITVLYKALSVKNNSVVPDSNIVAA